MPFGLKTNESTVSKDPNNSVYINEESEFEKGAGHTVTISVSVLIVSAVFVLCILLCYRQAVRRRKEDRINQENSRREFIRQAVRFKLQQLEKLEDTVPYLEQTETKVPLVTFGDVTQISPTHSPMRSPVPQDRNVYNNGSQNHNQHNTSYYHRVYTEDTRFEKHISYHRKSGLSISRPQQYIHRPHRLLNDHHTEDHISSNKTNTYNSRHYRFNAAYFSNKNEHVVNETPLKKHSDSVSVNSKNYNHWSSNDPEASSKDTSDNHILKLQVTSTKHKDGCIATIDIHHTSKNGTTISQNRNNNGRLPIRLQSYK